MADEQYQDYPTGVDNVHTSFSMESESSKDWPALPELSWREFFRWVIGQRSRHRIEGRSMLPLLQPGNEVLYSPNAYQRAIPQVGDIVIAQHPQQPDLLMIKRIGGIDGDRYYLLGDNRSESTDSRQLGWLQRSCLLGKVKCAFTQLK